MNIDPSIAFKNMLSDPVAPMLKQMGFRRYGATWGVRSTECWGIINFQKSWTSTRAELRFTINTGIFSDCLAEHLQDAAKTASPTKPPPDSKCHFRVRIGWLMPAKRDTWWTIDERTDIAALSDTMRTVLAEAAVPHVLTNLSNESLLGRALDPREHHVQMSVAQVARLIRSMRPEGELDEYCRALVSRLDDGPQRTALGQELVRLGWNTDLRFDDRDAEGDAP